MIGKFLICDECNAPSNLYQGHTSSVVLRIKLSGRGWTVRINDDNEIEDMCPNCDDAKYLEWGKAQILAYAKGDIKEVRGKPAPQLASKG